MKRAITLSVLGAAVLLTGCTGEQAACLKAVADANAVTLSRLEKQATVMAAGLKSEDVAVRASSQTWFMMMEKTANLIDPTRCSDSTLEWAKLIIPAATGVINIVQANKTARHASDNSVELQRVNMGTLGSVAVQGIDAASKSPVIVGPTEGVEVLYPAD